jgi:serpin B
MLRSSRFVVAPIAIGAALVISGCQQNLAAPTPLEVPRGENIAAVVEGNNEFAFDLYAQLAAAGDKNLFFSPQSIASALAMTYAGARGETAQQMAEVLRFVSPAEELHAATGALLSYWGALGAQGDVQLAVANRLWGQRGYQFLDSFTGLLRDKYGADLEQLDFEHPEAARQTINQWVSQATSGKIDDLIPQGVLNPLTRLVLTNAIYFQGDWEHAFRKEATKPSKFHLTESDSIENVPLMYQKRRFAFGRTTFADEKELLLLEMPYKGSQLSMLVLLPGEVGGLAELEAHLSAENVQEWASAMRPTEVKVWLPRFKMSAAFQLKDVLSAMGMQDAFTGDADFSGMDATQELFISAVIHKAFVDVNEKGTEAAAATGVVVDVMSAPPSDTPTFRADHPFVFLLRDNTTGAILFIGRVIDPR